MSTCSHCAVELGSRKALQSCQFCTSVDRTIGRSIDRYMVPNIIRMALSYNCQRAKTVVVLVVCFSRRSELRWHPHMDIGRPPFRTAFGARQVHTEEYTVTYQYKLFACRHPDARAIQPMKISISRQVYQYKLYITPFHRSGVKN
jgi:hypothetical protein